MQNSASEFECYCEFAAPFDGYYKSTWQPLPSLTAADALFAPKIIVEALLSLGMTSQEIAKQIGVSSHAITNWSKGHTKMPRPYHYSRLLSLYCQYCK